MEKCIDCVNSKNGICDKHADEWFKIRKQEEQIQTHRDGIIMIGILCFLISFLMGCIWFIFKVIK